MRLRVTAKSNDTNYVEVFDDDGNVVAEKDGYFPEGLGLGGGDYVEFEIDIDTGQILNWKRPTDEALKLQW